MPNTLADQLATWRRQLTEVHAALLTAMGSDLRLLEDVAVSLCEKIEQAQTKEQR